jgi:hypothetical protein
MPLVSGVIAVPAQDIRDFMVSRPGRDSLSGTGGEVDGGVTGSHALTDRAGRGEGAAPASPGAKAPATDC